MIAMLAAFGAGPYPLRSGTARQAQGDITISVPGIPGPYCMYGIEKRLAEMPEVEGVRLLWQEEAIRVALRAGATVTREEIEEAIERAEYPYQYEVKL
jgi:cation transport ATPase